MARPLERTTKGKPYTRPPAIEAAIDEALAQDLNTQCRRALIRRSRDAEYLPTECLVHLIRHARRADDSRAYNALLPLLLARCEAILNNKIDSEMPGAVELREDILGDLAELFAIDGTEDDDHKLDFFEIRFNMAFSTFRITRVRQALGRSEVQLPEPSGEVELTEQEADNEVTTRLDELQADDGNPENRVFRKQVLQAIIDLPPDERKAVVLVYLLGSTREVAGKLCDVDERTIRNRLKRVFAKLSKKLKEDA